MIFSIPDSWSPPSPDSWSPSFASHDHDFLQDLHVSMSLLYPGGYMTCRLSLLTNSAPRIRVQMRGGGSCGVSANEYSCAHHVTWSTNKHWRSTSIFNLCFYPLIHGIHAIAWFIISVVYHESWSVSSVDSWSLSSVDSWCLSSVDSWCLSSVYS